MRKRASLKKLGIEATRVCTCLRMLGNELILLSGLRTLIVRRVFRLEEDSAKNNSIILYLLQNDIIRDLPRNDYNEIYEVPRVS
jgi:hypothetical protein